jgi:hypothetical protein
VKCGGFTDLFVLKEEGEGPPLISISDGTLLALIE